MTKIFTTMKHRVGTFKASENGTTMPEFALVISLFLLILFAILDFSRLGYQWVISEKAMQRAVRIAAVRPPMCKDVPLFHTAGGGSYTAGTLCREAIGVCAAPAAEICTLDTTDTVNFDTDNDLAVDTADEIWASIEPLVPTDAGRANVQITYEYDPLLGFFGGPFVPRITATLIGENGEPFPFTFVTPLSSLAATAGADTSNYTSINSGQIPFPDIKVTLPAEDMNIGMRG